MRISQHHLSQKVRVKEFPGVRYVLIFNDLLYTFLFFLKTKKIAALTSENYKRKKTNHNEIEKD